MAYPLMGSIHPTRSGIIAGCAAFWIGMIWADAWAAIIILICISTITLTLAVASAKEL